jgi:hypothetical protein
MDLIQGRSVETMRHLLKPKLIKRASAIEFSGRLRS